MNIHPHLQITNYLEAVAVIVSALGGMLKAAEKKMDIVGTYSLALLVAFGGGTLRDILLQRRPFFWVENSYYLLIVLLLCTAFVYINRAFLLANRLYKRSNTIDAMGLALFSLSGLQLGFVSGLSLLPAVLMGVITGVAGGVFRDVVVNEIPVIFRPGGLYAVAAFAGCWVYIACEYAHIPTFICNLIASAFIVVLRLVSVFLGVSLPDPLWMKEKKN